MKKENWTTIISFSGGRSSAMMTKILIDKMHEDEYLIIFTNTGKEREETLQFVHDCGKNWGVKVYWLEFTKSDPGYKIVDFDTASRNGEPFEEMIDSNPYLPNVVQRICTSRLKVRPVKKFVMDLGFTHWDNALGIRYDEPIRAHKIKARDGRERWDTILPLYDLKITEADVFAFWDNQSFDLQLNSYQGNCDFCFLKAKGQLIQLMREDPAGAKWWIDQENKTGATFSRRYSYSELLNLAQNSPLLFDEITDQRISCFCGD